MLKYIGNGWIHGIPARDLSDEEVQKYGKKQLIESGLYIEANKSEVKHGYQGTKKIAIRG